MEKRTVLYILAIVLGILFLASISAVDFYPQGNIDLMADWNIMNVIDFNCQNCINSSDVNDLDSGDIEGDINTFVDIAGDHMAGPLYITSSTTGISVDAGDSNLVNVGIEGDAFIDGNLVMHPLVGSTFRISQVDGNWLIDAEVEDADDTGLILKVGAEELIKIGQAAGYLKGIAMHDRAAALAEDSTAIGYECTATDDQGLCLGTAITCGGQAGTCMGYNYTSDTANSLAVGYGGIDLRITSGLADFQDTKITTTGDSNFSNIQADAFHSFNALGDSNIANLAFSGNVYGITSLGDANFFNVEADYFYGDGSGLLNLPSGLTQADANLLYVPYIEANEDVNLGEYGLTANDLNVMILGLAGDIYGINSLGDANFANLQADNLFGINSKGDANFTHLGATSFFGGTYYGDGSNLTGVMTQADANYSYVPYVDADTDTNLGVHGLTANDLNAMTLGLAGNVYGIDSLGDANFANLQADKFFAINSFGDANFTQLQATNIYGTWSGNHIAAAYVTDTNFTGFGDFNKWYASLFDTNFTTIQANEFFAFNALGDSNAVNFDFSGNLYGINSLGDANFANLQADKFFGINSIGDANFDHLEATSFFGGIYYTNLAEGSIPFVGVDGNLYQNDSNLFWSDSNNRLGIGMNLGFDERTGLSVTGDIDIMHTATESDDHAMELDVNAAGFGDIKGIDIDYITGAISAGEDEAVILVNIDESSATGGDIIATEVLSTEGQASIYGMLAGALVNPIVQLSGTFTNMDSATVKGVDNLTAFTSTATDVTIFVADDDNIAIGNATKFEEIEFLLDTTASPGIKPTFEYSTGAETWATFSPVDGTNEFRNSGVVAWQDEDIPNWDAGTGSEYLIRITRTRNVLVTTPKEDKVQIASTTRYKWDKDGDVSVRDMNAGRDMFVTNDLNVAGSDSNMLNLGITGRIFGDGSGLTGLLKEADANLLYVPYLGANEDINLGTYGLAAFGDLNFGDISMIGDFYGLNVKGDANFTQIQATNYYGGTYYGSGANLSGVATTSQFLPDTTLDTNTTANTNWLGTTHKFTTDQNIDADLNVSGTDSNMFNLGITGSLFTKCDSNTVLTADNDCVAITGFHTTGTGQSEADANKLYVPYLEANEDTNLGKYALTANDLNAMNIGLAGNIYGINSLGDANFANIQADNLFNLNALGDSNIVNINTSGNIYNINSLGDANFTQIQATNFYGGTYYGDGSNLTLLGGDVNTFFVPYAGTTTDINIGEYGLTANDMNAMMIGAANFYGGTFHGLGSGLTDMTITADINSAFVAYIDGVADVNLGVYGLTANDINVMHIGAPNFYGGTFHGLGAGLTDMTITADINSAFVSYIDAVADVNLGVHRLTANDLNAMTVGLAGNVYGINSLGDANFANIQADSFHSLNSLGDANFVNIGTSGDIHVGSMMIDYNGSALILGG